MMTDDKFISQDLSDEHLSSADEKEGEFVGATLSLKSTTIAHPGPGNVGVHSSHANRVVDDDNDHSTKNSFVSPIDNQTTATDPNLNRGRPGSVYSRRSIQSSGSKTSMRPNFIKTEEASNLYFSYKENSFEISVRKCSEHIKRDIDGSFQGAWILTEIDHWNNDQEKLVMLTDDSLLIFKYNFITQNVMWYKRVMLHIIDTMKIGDIVYPNFSVMPEREYGGIQVCWNRGQTPTFGQRWNPWCSDIPWTIFAHHPLIYNPKENETTYFSVDDFYECLLDSTKKCYGRKRPNENPTIVEGSILLPNYINIPSMIFNRTSLGYSRDRNGFCF